MSVITWYYALYNAAQAMIHATDGSSPSSHTATADAWYYRIVQPKLIESPFDYCLSSLVKKDYLLLLELKVELKSKTESLLMKSNSLI
jgi:hypothetical protein